ncbi:superoxide dismutase [Evansella sp. AB-rgal1]|uniref:superoxide dismutase n=1 Tax=Evansella sp. AB-rgal1 TaxID=3242696 RepID=UPI00359E0FBA
MSEHNHYKKEVTNWLTNFLKEVKESLEFPNKEELTGKVKELLDLLQQRDSFDNAGLSYIENEVEQLYSAYLLGIESRKEQEQRVPIGGHKLPKLNYSYDALEPYIHRRIMELHHKNHHQSYVDGLNKTEKELQEQRKKNKFNQIKHWQRELAFHGSGHYLHSLFWDVMSPQGGGKAKGSIGNQITNDFGSFQAFKSHFSEAANSVEGSGWAILVWVPRTGRLEILTAEKHQNLTQWDSIPILPLDVWEHAYYLQYENERDRYVENWWSVVDWNRVEERFQSVKDGINQ